MKDSCKTAVVAAVAGGYLLGRTKKAKLALALASLFAGRRLGLDPQELIGKGLRKVGEIPQFEELGDQVRDQLMTAARTAVTSTVNRRLDSFSDSLHERTRTLTGEAEPEEPEEPEDEGPEDEEDQDEEGRDREAARRERRARRQGQSSRGERAAGTGASTATKKAGQARKRTSSTAKSASKTASKTAGKPAGKAAGGTAKKSAASAKKTAGRAGRGR